MCDYNHIFIDSIRESSLPAMGIEIENSILIVDEAHNLPDRIRKGLERNIRENVFRRALSDIEEYKGNLNKISERLDISEAHGLEEATILEQQIKALRNDTGVKRWFSKQQTELENSGKDDIRIETSDFLGIISRTINSIGGREEDVDSTIRKMCESLRRVMIEDDDSLEEDEENDCIRLAEFLSICLKYRDNTALALVFDNLGDEKRITSHLLDPALIGKPLSLIHI